MCKKCLLIGMLALAAVVMLAACGGTPAPSIKSAATSAPVAVEQTAVVREVVVAATWTPPATPAEGEAVAAAPGATLPRQAQAGRMIIKNAELDLLVADTDVALDGVTAIASDYGGYIVSTRTWFEQEFKYATVRLGVPVLEFENVLRRLRGLAVQVTNETASGEDVTDQYVDLQSQLTNLRATQARIREFLDKAKDVKEALEVNAQLSEIEGQIEEIQGKMNYFKDRAAYSTISIQLVPQRPTPTPTPTPTQTPTATPTPTPTPAAWRPGETVKGATNVLTSILKGLVEIAIWVVIVLGPFLIPIVVVVWLVIRWQRRRNRPKSPTPPPDAAS